jgi:hypothetical protein
MIFEDLVIITNAMQDLKRKTAIKKNKDMQEITDTKYRVLLMQVNLFIVTIEYLYTDVNVQKNDEILTSMSELLGSLEKVVESGLASQDLVFNAENSFKIIQGNMKKEWLKQYVDMTGATVSTLEAIRGIDSEKVGSCLQKIQQADSWDLDVKRYRTMSSGLDDAEQLIVSLGLDDEIITFLQNTNSGKATLRDLNDKVLAWIRDENLEGKIRISFVKNR